MNDSLLKEKGFHPSPPILSHVDGYALKVGERATLVKATGERAYGYVMALSEEESNKLYGESSVADYRAEKVIATTSENVSLDVVVYNLPIEKLAGRNRQYAKSLAKIARDVGLPKEYIKKIESFAD
jgi:hypothetical protein